MGLEGGLWHCGTGQWAAGQQGGSPDGVRLTAVLKPLFQERDSEEYRAPYHALARPATGMWLHLRVGRVGTWASLGSWDPSPSSHPGSRGPVLVVPPIVGFSSSVCGSGGQGLEISNCTRPRALSSRAWAVLWSGTAGFVPSPEGPAPSTRGWPRVGLSLRTWWAEQTRVGTADTGG